MAYFRYVNKREKRSYILKYIYICVCVCTTVTWVKQKRKSNVRHTNVTLKEDMVNRVEAFELWCYR